MKFTSPTAASSPLLPLLARINLLDTNKKCRESSVGWGTASVVMRATILVQRQGWIDDFEER